MTTNQLSRAVVAAILLFVLGVAPARAEFWGGGTKYDKVSWGLCVGSACAVASNITVPYIVVAPAKFSKCYAASKTGPAGAALQFDIRVNGDSIFGAGQKLQIADGATSGTIATFAAPAVAEGALISIDIFQVGTTTAGKDVSVVCRLSL